MRAPSKKTIFDIAPSSPAPARGLDSPSMKFTAPYFRANVCSNYSIEARNFSNKIPPRKIKEAPLNDFSKQKRALKFVESKQEPNNEKRFLGLKFGKKRVGTSKCKNEEAELFQAVKCHRREKSSSDLMFFREKENSEDIVSNGNGRRENSKTDLDATDAKETTDIAEKELISSMEEKIECKMRSNRSLAEQLENRERDLLELKEEIESLKKSFNQMITDSISCNCDKAKIARVIPSWEFPLKTELPNPIQGSFKETAVQPKNFPKLTTNKSLKTVSMKAVEKVRMNLTMARPELRDSRPCSTKNAKSPVSMMKKNFDSNKYFQPNFFFAEKKNSKKHNFFPSETRSRV